MTKEQKIREYESKQLIEELSKMPPMVIATAYLYAVNYTLYGEDVTEKWVTATQQAYTLEKARRDGYYEALQKLAKSEIRDQNDVLNKIIIEIEDDALDLQEIDGEHESFMVVDLNDVLQIIDKYKAEPDAKLLEKAMTLQTQAIVESYVKGG